MLDAIVLNVVMLTVLVPSTNFAAIACKGTNSLAYFSGASVTKEKVS